MNALFCGLPAVQISKLQRIQNITTHLDTLTKCSSHITPQLKGLHWLPVAQRVKYKVLLLVFKCQHNMTLPYLQDLIHPYKHYRGHQVSTSWKCLSHSKVHFATYLAFSLIGPCLWNKLDLRTVSSVTTFKSNLKTILFREQYCR